jgi:hypothetical protein
MQSLFHILVAAAIILCSCSSNNSAGDNSAATAQASTTDPKLKFNADSAYSYIKAQVDFGPRVPGTAAHKKCAEYIMSELVRHGIDTIVTQNAIVTAFNSDQLPMNNIIGKINPHAKDRVLIAAHYDTRPWADNEDDDSLKNNPIDGANDGASGVGVMLELARTLCDNRPEIGVDFLFVDVEDYGTNEGWGSNEESWCLGTQYWAEHTGYTPDNKPRYGIVLDMVGGTNARFHREYYSNQAAKNVVDKVWGTAANTGYGAFFPNEIGGALIDDHLFINRAGIPCIDIVECNNTLTRSFPPTWHTLRDNMASIDTRPLKAVGQTVLNVVSSEKRSK